MKRPLSVITFSFILFTVACTHDPFNFGELQISDSCSEDSVYFVNEVLPLLNSSCGIPGCHDEITQEDGIVLTSWEHIMNSDVVNPGDPGDSELIEVLFEGGDDRMPPPPNDPLTSAEIALLQTWIEQGAPNNECAGACETSNVTFSNSIAPLVATSCEGCHSGSYPSAGISLTNYDQIAAIASSGAFYGVVTSSSGWVSMPPGIELSECNKETIRIWVENGYPND